MIYDESSGIKKLDKIQRKCDTEIGTLRLAFSKEHGLVLVFFIGEYKESHIPCYYYVTSIKGYIDDIGYYYDKTFLDCFLNGFLEYSLSDKFQSQNIIPYRDLKLFEKYDNIVIREKVVQWLIKNKLYGIDYMK